MNLFYEVGITSALSFVEAMDAIPGDCVNPAVDDCDCDGCLFNLSRFKRRGADAHDWCMRWALEEWRIQLKKKQKGRK
jgi:hypothetical protein